MPDFVWSAIIAGASVSVVAVLVAVFRGRVTVATKWGTISPANKVAAQIGGTRRLVGSVALDAMVRFTERNVGGFHRLVYQRYLKLMVERGADRDFLTKYEGSQLMNEIAWTLARSGNGSHSVQQIIEQHILSLDWVGYGPEKYVRAAIAPKIIDTVRRRLNDRYESEYRNDQDEMIKRRVSNTDIVDEILTGAFFEDVVKFALPFFEFAERCRSHGCADAERME